MEHDTFAGYLDQWAEERPDVVWLRDRQGDEFTEWTWAQAHPIINTMAARLEERFGNGVAMAILSRNRAHWFYRWRAQAPHKLRAARPYSIRL